MKRRIHQLLAVVSFVGAATSSALASPRTLANGAPAPGNTVAKGYVKREKVTSSQRQMERARRALARAISDERDALQALAMRPRQLAGGAPACGNTGGKAPACTAERADEEYRERIARAKQARADVIRARMRLHEVTVKYALQRQQDVNRTADLDDEDDDYS